MTSENTIMSDWLLAETSRYVEGIKKDIEFLGEGEDSIVYRAGDKAVKFYIKGKFEDLDQDEAGRILELYRDVTCRAQEFFKDKPVLDGDKTLPVEVNKIEDLIWFPEYSCWVSVSPYVSGIKCQGELVHGMYSPIDPDLENILSQFADTDTGLRTYLNVTPISIRSDNFKVQLDDNGLRIGIVVTDLACDVGYLKRVEDYDKHKQE